MAIAATSIGSLGDTANISTYTCTLARAPAANALIVALVSNTNATGTLGLEPTSVRGADFIFSLVTSSLTFALGATDRSLSIWRSMSPTALSGTTVGVKYSSNQSGVVVIVTEFTGVDTSGTSGSGAVNQSANSGPTGAISALTLIAPVAANVNNAWFSGEAVGTTAAGDTDVPNLNFTNLDKVNHSTPNNTLHSAWTTLSTGTITGWQGSGGQTRTGVIAEIVAAAVAGGGVASPYYVSYYYPRVVNG